MATVQDVLQAINQLRTNPQSFIPDLERYLSCFQGNTLHIQGEIPLMTNEGPSAVHECINALKNQGPLNPLELADGLSKAAADHANDIGPRGICGHNGSNGSTMTSRIETYGDWMGNIGENIDFGGNKSGRQIILNLIIDDGVPSRGHRKNCLSPNFKKIGIGMAPHAQYKGCCVMDFAGQFNPKGSQPQQSYNNNYNNFNQLPQQQQPPQFQQMQQQFIGGGGQMQQMTSMQSGGSQNMPPGCVGMSTSTQTSQSGNTRTIKTTITYQMQNGSTRTETQTQTMTV